MRKSGKILAFLLAVVLVFCACAVIATANADTGTSSGTGRTFTSSDEFSMTNHLQAQPMTYKALISVPTSASTRGVIFGNYREADISCLNFEITAGGKPSIYYIDSSKVENRITFDYDVRGLGWVDVAITQTIEETGSVFTCYINGDSIGTVTTDNTNKISLASCQRLYPFALGHDWYSDSYYFKGAIQNVAIYDSALTAQEIAKAYEDGVDLNDASLLAYYDLNKPENQTGTVITDSTAGDHDFERLFQETRRDFEYDYSLAVVGDTQHLIYRDAHHNEDWTSPIYDWLVANKESKNIKFVMGVGDITNRDGKDDVNDGVNKTDVEWDIAVAQLNKLYDGGIPYSLVVGNHDSVAQLDKFFADNPNFSNADIDYYNYGSLGNYYITFDVDDTKYMVFGLEYGPNDDILAWAGDVIANSPEYRVIITTHAYMCANGTTLESHESTSVPRPTNPNATEENRNNGDDIWHELASRYENIMFVFSGHISASDIVYRKDYGDNGNTVYQMLMDFQTMDTKYSRKTGMVAMLYFTNDGNIVNVEYVSTYRSLAAQKNDPDAKDIVYRPAVNSFSIEFPEEKGVGEETKYGTISPTYVDKELYPVVLFKKDGTFIGGFYNLNRAIESVVSVYNDQNDDYVILLRRDCTTNRKAVSYASFNGELVIDLDGYTLSGSENYMMIATFSGANSCHPCITFKNGTIEKTGENVGLLNFGYTSSLSRDAYCDLTFENVTFRSLVTNNKNTSVIFITFENGNATAAVRVNAVFNDCTFDFVNSVSDALMLPLKHYYKDNQNDRVVYNVTINGGKAIANTASAFTSRFVLCNNNNNGRADSIKYGPNAEGKYFELVLPAGTAAPTTSYTLTNGGEGMFSSKSTSEETATYPIVDVTRLSTKYGPIGEDYADPDLYPVVLFEKTSSGYVFKGGYATFNQATSGSAEKTDTATTGVKLFSSWYSTSKTYVFLLRKDAEFTGYTNMN